MKQWRAFVILGLVTTGLVGVAPVSPTASATSGPPGVFYGACDVTLVAERVFNDMTVSTPEPGTCITNQGTATVDLAGEARGVPGLTCAGGVADGSASLLIENRHRTVDAPTTDFKVANTGGIVTLQVVAISGSVRVVATGTFVQSPSVVSTCLSPPAPVTWTGRLVFASWNLS